jgi:glycosyltransferase involved in cell wall biosynthesis
MSMTLSVVVPTFNRPEATLRAIRSALEQTRPPDEIIVVDDASTPPFLLNDSSLCHKSIRILTLPTNRGASAARQAGVDAATSDVIAFLDSDDRWLPEKLAAQMAFLDQSSGNLVAIACGWLEEGSNSRQRIPIPSDRVADFASGCWFAPGSTVIVPRNAFVAVGPFDPNLRRLEDLDWFLRFALCGGRLEVAPMMGAVISIGRRGRGMPVEQASSRLLERFRTKLEPAVLRRLAAYLDLELAAAARNDGRYGAMALHLARSFLRSPRPHMPLRQWWLENDT